MSLRPRHAPWLLTGLLGALGCGASVPPRFPDRAPLLREPEKPFSPPPPEDRDVSDKAIAAEEEFFEKVDQRLALAPRARRAVNVNSLDEVPDSSFFVNRIARVTPAEVRHGGEVGDPIDAEHDLEVLKAKTAGVTGGFVVRDARGVKFVLKFDPVGFYGLLSGSEAVASRLIWAAGYNVPDNRLVYIAIDRFVPSGRPDAPTPAEIAAALGRAARAPDGRVRALASRFVEGKVLGPMRWRSVRAGDPNDRVPHVDRRELRGLRVLYTWINDPDSKAGNSLDTFVPGPDGRGLVRHYLLDFGTSLGAGGSGTAATGWWLRIPARPGWSDREGVDGVYRSTGISDASREHRRARIGRLVASLLPSADPWTYRFIANNGAFDAMEEADAAWAARILVQFDEAKIRAAAEAADWPRADTEELVRRLLARRRAVARAVFARASSLGPPVVAGRELCAIDLAARERLVAAPVRRYVVRGGRGRVEGARICLTPPARDGYHVVAVRVARPRGAPRARELRVHVARRGDALRIVGVERD